MKRRFIYLALISLCICSLQLNAQQESIKTDDAITIGEHGLATPDSGTIEFDGEKFRVYDGIKWSVLGQQWLEDTSTYNGVNYIPLTPSSTVGIHDNSINNPGAWLYINNAADTSAGRVSPTIPHAIWIDDVHNRDLTVSMKKDSGAQYTFGIDTMNRFSIIADSTLAASPAGSNYSDHKTGLELNVNGIANLPNQSRARAWMSAFQAVDPFFWTPLEFDAILYDEHAEFVPAPAGTVIYPPVVPTMETAFFVALTEGYYQVNARCEIRLDTFYDPFTPMPYVPGYTPNAHVSLGIFKNAAPPAGGTSGHA